MALPDDERLTARQGRLTPAQSAFAMRDLGCTEIVWPRTQAISRGWLVLVIGLYAVLGLPVVANAIAGRLPRVPPANLVPGQRVDTLIVLDGDNRVGRVKETLRVWRLCSVGSVVVLGEAWIAEELIAAGLPTEKLTRTMGPGTTRGQMAWIRQHSVLQPAAQTALIASRLQMPRIAALAKANGITVVLDPSPIDIEPPTSGMWQFVPMYIALRTSRDALYEHAALMFYRWRGWTKPL
jgi:uncharacterized SAM-binding protein YcdF (DUF218 family)